MKSQNVLVMQTIQLLMLPFHSTILEFSDTDIVVILVADSRARYNIFLQHNELRYNVADIKLQLKQNIIEHAQVTTIISGCDSVSALFRKEKTWVSML